MRLSDVPVLLGPMPTHTCRGALRLTSAVEQANLSNPGAIDSYSNPDPWCLRHVFRLAAPAPILCEMPEGGWTLGGSVGGFRQARCVDVLNKLRLLEIRDRAPDIRNPDAARRPQTLSPGKSKSRFATLPHLLKGIKHDAALRCRHPKAREPGSRETAATTPRKLRSLRYCRRFKIWRIAPSRHKLG